MSEAVKRIRLATSADAGRIAEILVYAKRVHYRAIFQDDVGSFVDLQVLPVAQRYLAHPETLAGLWVYDDGIVKGMIRLDGDEIAELYVDPFFQHSGIGHVLMTFACTQQGCRWLWVIEKNAQAIRFYQRHGFSLTGERQLVQNTRVPMVKKCRM